MPEMPVSISSKISVSIRSASDSAAFIASIMRDISPPLATLTSGFTGSPRFAESRNDTVSMPVSESCSFGISLNSVSIAACGMPMSFSSATVSFINSFEAALRRSESAFASVPKDSTAVRYAFSSASMRFSPSFRTRYSFSIFSRYARISAIDAPYLRFRFWIAARRLSVCSRRSGSNRNASRPSRSSYATSSRE